MAMPCNRLPPDSMRHNCKRLLTRSQASRLTAVTLLQAEGLQLTWDLLSSALGRRPGSSPLCAIHARLQAWKRQVQGVVFSCQWQKCRGARPTLPVPFQPPFVPYLLMVHRLKQIKSLSPRAPGRLSRLSVRPFVSAEVTISRFVGFNPSSGSTAGSVWRCGLGFSLSLPLPCSCCLCLSQINKTLLKT